MRNSLHFLASASLVLVTAACGSTANTATSASAKAPVSKVTTGASSATASSRSPAGKVKAQPTGTPSKPNVVAISAGTDVVPSHDELATGAKMAWAQAVAAAAAKDTEALAKLLPARSARMVARGGDRMTQLFRGEVVEVIEVNGGRVALRVKADGPAKTIVTYYKKGRTLIDVMKSRRYRAVRKGASDPLNRPLTLKEATAGVKGVGKLWVTFATNKGEINCRLFEAKAPRTVANFVGLARGLRGFKGSQEQHWTKRRFYDGLGFHRVIPKFMIQGGCPLGTGAGGPGFAFEDEFDLTMRHDRGGLLSMANSGPHTNGSQFFITEQATPHLDDGHTIFGACEEVALVKAIARVPAAAGNRPTKAVVMHKLSFVRKP